MFTIKNASGARFNQEELDQLNKAKEVLLKEGHEFTSFREFISTLSVVFIKQNEALDKKVFDEIVEVTEEIELTWQEKYNNFLHTLSQDELIKFKEKSKEDPLTPEEIREQLKSSQILIDLNDEELEVFEQIRQYRGNLLKEKGVEIETPEELAKNFIFNEAALNNFSGAFVTGF